MRILLSGLALVMLLSHPGFAQCSFFAVELEAGPVWQSRNDVEGVYAFAWLHYPIVSLGWAH